jgi:hypothetical protein
VHTYTLIYTLIYDDNEHCNKSSNTYIHKNLIFVDDCPVEKKCINVHMCTYIHTYIHIHTLLYGENEHRYEKNIHMYLITFFSLTIYIYKYIYIYIFIYICIYTINLSTLF